MLLVLGVGITSLSSTAGFLWLSAIGFLIGGAMLAVASVGPIRKASPAAPGKPHRHWFSGRRDGRPRRRFEQE